ncbi:hypothetical protein [Candidatus Cyanaurora vandensis]|uniref:hypothetical protein n=1 Tax=Candidatus Cyanaurora vandensis TaxID=2714958 RepID=UPI00257BB5C7|nr:hypothetical protein [Candidatus Cyanaurora vandensis]
MGRGWSTLGLMVGLMGIPVMAGGDLTKQEPILVTVQLGTVENELKFVPNLVTLETGKLYKLILVNPSPQAHYFSSEGMAQAVFTRKVQINNAQGKAIAEVKGSVREIEVYPKGTTEWWFVPVKAGSFNDLKCTITGHTEGGMTGRVVIN